MERFGALVFAAALVVTSLGAYLVGSRRMALPPAALGRAVGRALDCVGLGLVFLALNLLVGAALVLGLRAATGRFVSLYVLNDGMILLLSVLQGMIAQWWRQEGR